MQGPAFVLDTACSSSLVALGMAKATIHSYDSTGAVLAGGSNVLLSYGTSILYSRSGMLARDCRCKTFDSSADGYGRGEAIATVLVGSHCTEGGIVWLNSVSVNQDGSSSSMTAPNGYAQEILLKGAWQQVDEVKHSMCIELHGTGTPLGDPIEVYAFGKAMLKTFEHKTTATLSASKSLVGHTEASAGILSVINRMLLMQQNRTPQFAHFKALSTHLRSLLNSTVHTCQIARQCISHCGEYCGVSSFGFSGTNAHSVVSGSNGTCERTRPTFVSWRTGLPTDRHCLVDHAQMTKQKTLASLTSKACFPMLWDHVVQDRVILPGTAFMELAHAAAHTLLGGEGSGSASVANASLVTPLVLQHTEPSAEPGRVAVQVLATGAVRLASPAGTLHVAGHLAALAPASLRPRPAGGRRWAGRQARGPRQGLTALVGGSAAQASQRGFSVDPAAMDNALHLAASVAGTRTGDGDGDGAASRQTFVPAAVGAYCPQRALGGASGPLTAAARALPAWPAGGGAKVSSHWLLTAAGEAHAHLSRLQSRALRPAPPGPAGAAAREGGAAGAAGAAGVAGAAGGSLLYGSCWRASTPPPAGGTAPGPPSARAARAPVAVRWGGPPGENAGRALALALSVPPARPAGGGTQAGLLGLVLGAHRGLLQALQPALRVSPELVVRACSPGPSGAWGAEPGGAGHAGAGATGAGAHAALQAFLKTLEAEAPRLRWQAVGTDPRDAAGPLAPWPAPPPGAAGVGAVAAEGRATSSAASRRAVSELVLDRCKAMAPPGRFSFRPNPRGSLNNLQCVPASPSKGPQPSTLSGRAGFTVHAVGLNFRDVLNVLGMYPGDPGPPGGDFAGVVVEGDAFPVGTSVFGLAPGCLGSFCTGSTHTVQHKPSHMSFCEAATLPTVFATVAAALEGGMGHRADYRVVLVHTASGGIGQAALQMLHLQGSSVMATAGSSMKRTLVRQHGAKVACSSRDLWFGEAALTGAGPSPETGLSSPDSHIGLVINSLMSPGTLGASLGACGPGACFVELSKRSIWSHSRVAQDRHDVLYNIVALDLMHPASVGGILSRISALAASGHIEGLQTNLFTFNSLPSALRSMSSGGHTGKVVCYNPDPPKTPARNWHISGGLGALGALAAAWLANGGASSLVLLGRTGHSRAVQQDHPAHLKQPLSAGLVHTARCDMSSSEETCEALGRGAFAGARGRPGASSAQRGVLHAGGVLRDATLPNQTVAGARAVTGPKVAGLHHILAACAGMPVQALKLFSSVAAFLGSPGQLNYSTANAQLDAAAGELYQQGLAGVSVQWGPWGGGGMAQASRATEQRMERMGLHMLDAQQGLRTLAAAVGAVAHSLGATGLGALPHGAEPSVAGHECELGQGARRGPERSAGRPGPCTHGRASLGGARPHWW